MGTNEAQTVSVVKLRFAERAEAGERTFERSAVFRGLCREYSLCAAALARWQVSDAPEAGLQKILGPLQIAGDELGWCRKDGFGYVAVYGLGDPKLPEHFDAL